MSTLFALKDGFNQTISAGSSDGFELDLTGVEDAQICLKITYDHTSTPITGCTLNIYPGYGPPYANLTNMFPLGDSGTLFANNYLTIDLTEGGLAPFPVGGTSVAQVICFRLNKTIFPAWENWVSFVFDNLDPVYDATVQLFVNRSKP